jgi:glutamate synthase domain-containing protein 2
LPGVKVDEEISRIRRVPVGKTVISPPGHTAFTNPPEMCGFIQKLRDLSDGKPIGLKFCLGRREEFLQMCEAMVQTGVYPDFITVDGGEGGTGAAPFDFINYVGSPLKEALFFVHTTLKSFGLREHVRVIASGKVMTAFNILEKLALGADLCNSARGMMLAIGCIQAYRCNTNKCPTGVATTDPALTKGLDVTDKGVRVAHYHKRTMIAMADLLGAMGLHSTKEVELKHISVRHNGRVVNLSELFAETAELSILEQAERMRRAQGENAPPEPPSR